MRTRPTIRHSRRLALITTATLLVAASCGDDTPATSRSSRSETTTLTMSGSTAAAEHRLESLAKGRTATGSTTAAEHRIELRAEAGGADAAPSVAG